MSSSKRSGIAHPSADEIRRRASSAPSECSVPARPKGSNTGYYERQQRMMIEYLVDSVQLPPGECQWYRGNTHPSVLYHIELNSLVSASTLAPSCCGPSTSTRPPSSHRESLLDDEDSDSPSTPLEGSLDYKGNAVTVDELPEDPIQCSLISSSQELEGQSSISSSPKRIESPTLIPHDVLDGLTSTSPQSTQEPEIESDLIQPSSPSIAPCGIPGDLLQDTLPSSCESTPNTHPNNALPSCSTSLHPDSEEPLASSPFSSRETTPLESSMVNRIKRERRRYLPTDRLVSPLPTGSGIYTGPGLREADYPDDYSTFYFGIAAHRGGKVPKHNPRIAGRAGSMVFLKARLGLLRKDQYDRFTAWVLYLFIKVEYDSLSQIRENWDKYLLFLGLVGWIPDVFSPQIEALLRTQEYNSMMEWGGSGGPGKPVLDRWWWLQKRAAVDALDNLVRASLKRESGKPLSRVELKRGPMLVLVKAVRKDFAHHFRTYWEERCSVYGFPTRNSGSIHEGTDP